MKALLRAIPVLVFLLFVLIDGVFFVAGLGIFGFPEMFQEYLGASFFAIWAMVQIAVLFVIMQFIYVRPIAMLRHEIAYFLAGARQTNRLDDIPLNPDLAYVASFFHRSLEILRNFKEEFQSGRVLRSEVELAADIQKHVLKKSYPKVPLLDIVADTKSATEVGGDSYDIITQGDNTYIYLGDVTGHGVASGFVMMVVNALISGFSKMLVSSAEIIARTNEILKPRVKSNMLMSLLMVRWNESERKLYMTGAGHEYLIIYKKKQNEVYKVKSGGVALGITKDVSKILKEVQISFEPGDCIVLYTDGITEARNGNKESNLMFTVDRLVQTVKDAGDKTAHGLFRHITIELSKFMGYNHKQFDDITLIVAHYRGDTPSDPELTRDIEKEYITEWNWH